MAAAATGYISAALWKGQGAGSAAGRAGPAMPFCPDCGVTERASGHMVGRRLGHRRVLGALAGGLALLTAALVVVALEVPSAPPKPCTALNCLAPFALPPHPPRVYTSRDGWSVQWYPASAVFPERPPATSASPSASQLRLDFTNPGAPAEDGELAFTGGPARGTAPTRSSPRCSRPTRPTPCPTT